MLHSLILCTLNRVNFYLSKIGVEFFCRKNSRDICIGNSNGYLSKEDIVNISFGCEDWNKFFQAEVDYCVIPDDIIFELNKDDGSKKLWETHLLTFIPGKINGRPLTLKLLLNLFKRNKQEINLTFEPESIKNYCASEINSVGHWVLMKKKFDLSDDLSEFFLPLVDRFDKVKFLEALTSIVMHYKKFNIKHFFKDRLICRVSDFNFYGRRMDCVQISNFNGSSVNISLPTEYEELCKDRCDEFY